MSTILPTSRSAPVAFWQSGFRPFFLLGSVFGLLAVIQISGVMAGIIGFSSSALDIVNWHRHEMLFGYTAAIIAGFLLTAVPNWTGHPTLKGQKLGALVALWILGRVAVFYSTSLPPVLVGLVDCAFFLGCMAGILPALIAARNIRNYGFVLLLGLLVVSNSLAHSGHAEFGYAMALNIIILIMVVIGGRVIPFFTQNALGIKITRHLWLERLTVIATVTVLIADTATFGGLPMAAAFGALAILHGVRLVLTSGARMAQRSGMSALRLPLLWVLHAGYGWLVIGFALKALYYAGVDIPRPVVTHAFTLGGIGVLTLGMMARVSLGHSGRPLEVRWPMTLAFALMNMAALSRVFGVWILPDQIMRWIVASSLCWIAALSLFVLIYTPILIRPRLDGRHG